MNRLQVLKSALIGGASALTLVHPAAAKIFDIPEGDLATALAAYMKQSDVELVYADNLVRGHISRGARGDYTETAALTQILRGTGFTAKSVSSSAIGIVPAPEEPKRHAETIRVAAAAAPRGGVAGVETVVVTAEKKQENIQQVPIAVTALSQEQLTARQIAGGPDLLRDVPNMNFTKTNFTGYNIELRGIGTQAISVTTDPAVAVAFNDIPFIRNHFFEQEFFDLQDVEVLRGPQGTLYGRNATAGVVNIKSALPTDSYEAMLSADFGNYNNRRLEGMINIPIVGDKLDLRIAGEWTKRDGYTINEDTGQNVDGRDLWSGRVTLGWKPASNVQTYLVWEHFSEDDNRMRTAKQICKTAPVPTEVDGVPLPPLNGGAEQYEPNHYLSQGCEMTSLYSPDAFEVPNGQTLSYYYGLGSVAPLQAYYNPNFDPYASTTQSPNLRVIQTTLNPVYRAKNDTLEYNADWNITRSLTLTSQTGYNHDFLWSTEDYNRFDSTPGAFLYYPPSAQQGLQSCGTQQSIFNNAKFDCFDQVIPDPAAGTNGVPANAGIFCDPQLGCSDRLVAEDLSDEHAWQISQEFRLASHFDGPLNFSAGGNFLHYETEENYYVFINTLTLATAGWGPVSGLWTPGVSSNAGCLQGGYQYSNLTAVNKLGTEGGIACQYIDPNPLSSLNNEGHNYFLSQNPYLLDSYALFGELYYDFAPDLKATLGARWTEDQKHFIDIPSELLEAGYGYPVSRIVDQRWDAPTGRAVLDWTPDLAFTDQTLIYGSYAHGYKAGGANPPGAELLEFSSADISTPIHPLTFRPEFIDAFELGSKNTLLDNKLTVDGDIFYYNYTGYQISEIVDRTAINNNYNATVKGAELEANWEPMPGLKFGFTGGWEDATANNGDSGIDLMDRTAGNPNWMVVKPFPTQASNCILPTYVVAALLAGGHQGSSAPTVGDSVSGACGEAYVQGLDPVTALPYVPNPTGGYPPPPPGYPGFNPATAPNDGEGFDKNLSGNQLPNAPHFTTSLTAEYSMPVSADWIATFHTDLYWQSQSWARIFDDPIDKLHGYSNVNLSLILNSSNGWQVMGYVKNVFNITAITGTFLNSDDSGLTTNVFLTDPRLYGVRITKQLDQNDGFWGSDYSGYDLIEDIFGDKDGGAPPLWIELGGQLSRLDDSQQPFAPAFLSGRPSILDSSQPLEQPSRWSIDETAALSFQPDSSDWVFSASVRYGRSQGKRAFHQQTNPGKLIIYYYGYKSPHATHVLKSGVQTRKVARFADTTDDIGEQHSIIDFAAGKDVGLGMFGIADGSSVLSLGVRFAQFASRSNVSLESIPGVQPHYLTFPVKSAHGNFIKFLTGGAYHSNQAALAAKRSFHGIGPSISWNGSAPFAGDAKDGELTVDWGANAAVLFGRQRASVHHHTTGRYHNGAYPGYYHATPRVTLYQLSGPAQQARSRMATVPNIGAMFGISYKYNNAKVSFGYRADEFFGAMDGGIDTRKSENIGFFGPYANISIGLGG